MFIDTVDERLTWLLNWWHCWNPAFISRSAIPRILWLYKLRCRIFVSESKIELKPYISCYQLLFCFCSNLIVQINFQEMCEPGSSLIWVQSVRSDIVYVEMVLFCSLGFFLVLGFVFFEWQMMKTCEDELLGWTKFAKYWLSFKLIFQ